MVYVSLLSEKHFQRGFYIKEKETNGGLQLKVLWPLEPE